VIDELVVRLELPVSAGDRLEALLELVASDPHAPTTVRDRRRIADDHLADSPKLDRPDLVTARALAPLPVVVEYAAPLLEVGGTLVVWRGRRDAKAEAEAETAALLLGMEPHPPTRVLPYPRAEHRYLHLFSKVRETPPGFPRRPGIALKRPLGA
jgi:hypothetical protein